MPSPETWAAFLVATTVLLVIPGPSVVYVVTRTVADGRAAGLVSMLGLESALLVHAVTAAIGLSALVTSSPVALAVVRYAGASYLCWLGLSRLAATYAARSPQPAAVGAPVPPPPATSRHRVFLEGFLVDLLNPKTALFFLAFLPQFVDSARGSVTLQMLVLGLAVVPVAALCDSSYGFVAATLDRRFRGSRAAHRAGGGRLLDVSAAAVYLVLGVAVAF